MNPKFNAIFIILFFAINISGAFGGQVGDVVVASDEAEYSNGFEFKFDNPVDSENFVVVDNNEMFKLAFPRGWYGIKYFEDLEGGVVSNVQDICHQLFESFKYSIPVLEGPEHERVLESAKQIQTNLKQDEFKDQNIEHLEDYKKTIEDFIARLEAINTATSGLGVLFDLAVKIEKYLNEIKDKINFSHKKRLLERVDLLVKRAFAFYASKIEESKRIEFNRQYAQYIDKAAGEVVSTEENLEKDKVFVIKLLKDLIISLKIPIAVKQEQVANLKKLEKKEIRPYTLLMRSVVFAFRLSLIGCINKQKDILLREFGLQDSSKEPSEKQLDLCDYGNYILLGCSLKDKFSLNTLINCNYSPEDSNSFIYIIKQASDVIQRILTRKRYDDTQKIEFLNAYFATLDYLLFFFFLPYVIDTTRIAQGVDFEKMWKEHGLKTIYDSIIINKTFDLNKFKNLISAGWNAYKQGKDGLTLDSYNKNFTSNDYYKILDYINNRFDNSANVNLFRDRIYVYGSGFSNIKWIGQRLTELDRGNMPSSMQPALAKVHPSAKKPGHSGDLVEGSIVPLTTSLAVLKNV